MYRVQPQHWQQGALLSVLGFYTVHDARGTQRVQRLPCCQALPVFEHAGIHASLNPVAGLSLSLSLYPSLSLSLSVSLSPSPARNYSKARPIPAGSSLFRSAWITLRRASSKFSRARSGRSPTCRSPRRRWAKQWSDPCIDRYALPITHLRRHLSGGAPGPAAVEKARQGIKAEVEVVSEWFEPTEAHQRRGRTPRVRGVRGRTVTCRTGMDGKQHGGGPIQVARAAEPSARPVPRLFFMFMLISVENSEPR